MREIDFPSLYKAANEASAKAQRKFLVTLGANLALLVLAAGLSWSGSPSPNLSIAQTIVLICSLACTIYLSYRQPQKQWYSTRALSESIKTTTWRWMMRAEPFDGPDAHARDELVASFKKILEANRKISEVILDDRGAEFVTEKMLTNRQLSLCERKVLYDKLRIEDQLHWYQRKARQNAFYENVWFLIVVILNALALVGAVVRVANPSTEFWPTDVLTAAAGAALAWLQTRRYQELAASYTLTAYEIGLTRVEMPTDESESRFSVFVSDAENAFSREHTQWQARRDRD